MSFLCSSGSFPSVSSATYGDNHGHFLRSERSGFWKELGKPERQCLLCDGSRQLLTAFQQLPPESFSAPPRKQWIETRRKFEKFPPPSISACVQRICIKPHRFWASVSHKGSPGVRRTFLGSFSKRFMWFSLCGSF